MSRIKRLLAAILFAASAATMGGCSRAEASLLFASTTSALQTTSFSLSGQPVTVSAWIRATGNQTANGGFCFLTDPSVTGDSGGFIYFAANTALSFTATTNHFSIFTTTAGSWFFVAYTISGTTWTAYWSPANGGALSTANTTDAGVPTSFSNFLIAGGSGTFKGNIESVKVWSAALSAAEIRNEEFSIRPIRTANLFAWYPTYQQSDETVDYSGNGKTLGTPSTKPTTDTNPPIAWQFMLPIFLLSLRRRRLS